MSARERRRRNHLIGLLIVAGLAFILLARPVVFTPVPATATPHVVPDHVQAQLHGQPGELVHGIDVSHYQGVINWPKVAATRVVFAYMKATEGITYQDPSFNTNIAKASATKLKLGAYHFFEADDEPEQQLNNFLAVIRGKPLNLAPMVDVEVTDQQSAEELKQRLAVFLQQLKKATGCTPLIYSYRSFWQSDIGVQFNDYPFWLADYASKPSPPSGIANWLIWQYSESGTVAGINAPVDMDVMVDGKSSLRQIACKYSDNMMAGNEHD